MFTITSLPINQPNNEVYKITYFDNYMLTECSDGRKTLTYSINMPFQMIINRQKSVPLEQIMFPHHGWLSFPIGTFDKILENVYNFKGGDLLNLLN